MQADNTKDTRCYATTGLPQTSSMVSSGMCVPIAALSFPGPWILANARSGSERLLIGIVDPKNGSVELTLADGQTIAAPVDHHTGLFTWNGSAATKIRTITVGAASCTFDDAVPARALGPCLGSNALDGSGSTSGMLGSP